MSALPLPLFALVITLWSISIKLRIASDKALFTNKNNLLAIYLISTGTRNVLK